MVCAKVGGVDFLLANRRLSLMTELQKQRITEMRTRGDSYSQIATTLDISVNTVKSFCRRNNLMDNAPAKPTMINDDKHCKQCGQELVQQPKKKQRKFCSDECRAAWWVAHPDELNRKATYNFSCACCGKSFTAYGNKGRKYCTHTCYVARRFGKAVVVM